MNAKHLLATSLISLLGGSLSAQFLYYEGFNTTESFDRPASNVGWQGTRGNGYEASPFAMAEIGGTDTYPADFPDIGDVTSNDYRIQSVIRNGGGINNNPVSGASYGHGFWSPTIIFNVALASQEFGGFSSSQIDSVSWDLLVQGSSGTQVMRAMLQVGGSASDTDNWYVSNPLIQVDIAARGQQWTTDTVDASGSWIRMPEFDFSTGSFLWPESGGEKTAADFAAYTGYTFYEGPLPNGTVHGFGIFTDNRAGGNMRVDNFGIVAVPEPSTWGALLGTLTAALVYFRRRKQ